MRTLVLGPTGDVATHLSWPVHSTIMSTTPSDWDLLSSYAGLLSLACISIYAGSHGSLSVRYSHVPVPASHSMAAHNSAGALDCQAQNQRRKRTRRSRDFRPKTLISSPWFVAFLIQFHTISVTMFCQIGSVVLFGLYLIVKFYGKEWITWLLQWYFTVAGVGSVSKVCIFRSLTHVVSDVWTVVVSPLSPYHDGSLAKHIGKTSTSSSSRF